MANTTFNGPVRSENGFQTISVSSTTGAVSVTATLGASTSITNLEVSGNAGIGNAATDTLGFYGATPATQRAAAVQAASVVSASSYISVPANLAAWAAEVNATLTGLGLWKGAA